MAKLFKRGDVWHAYVPKLGGGVRRVSTLCTDRRAAEVALRRLEREAVDPAATAARKTTTQRVLDDYQRSRMMLGRSADTLSYVEKKAGILLAMLPRRAADITHPAVCRYIETRQAQGARATTVRKELGILKPALKLARRNGLWFGEPDDVIPHLDDDYKPRNRSLTPWELVGLVSVLPPSRAAHVVFIVATGARWGESLCAQGDDADETGTLWHLRGTKTEGADRWVPITGVRATLLRWVLGRDALPFRPWGNVRRDLAEACSKLGISPVTPNDLRRTFATWLRAAGVEAQLIAPAMGHVDSRMVERVYGRLEPLALAKLLEERSGVAAVDVPPAPAEAPFVGERYTCCDHVVSARLPAQPALENSEFSSKDRCPGTESNRRHGDFQAARLFADSGAVSSGCAADSSEVVHLASGTYAGSRALFPLLAATAALYQLLHERGAA